MISEATLAIWEQIGKRVEKHVFRAVKGNQEDKEDVLSYIKTKFLIESRGEGYTEAQCYTYCTSQGLLLEALKKNGLAQSAYTLGKKGENTAEKTALLDAAETDEEREEIENSYAPVMEFKSLETMIETYDADGKAAVLAVSYTPDPLNPMGLHPVFQSFLASKKVAPEVKDMLWMQLQGDTARVVAAKHGVSPQSVPRYIAREMTKVPEARDLFAATETRALKAAEAALVQVKITTEAIDALVENLIPADITVPATETTTETSDQVQAIEATTAAIDTITSTSEPTVGLTQTSFAFVGAGSEPVKATVKSRQIGVPILGSCQVHTIPGAAAKTVRRRAASRYPLQHETAA